ncbi:MAG TPA: phosphotransferase family protein [Baekduia sp.]|jgi:aminoglycoside phosphotransferase (APT) family kinase protein
MSEPDGIATGALEAWMRHRVDVDAPLDLRVIAGGRSNLTYAITDGAGRRFILRRPPRGRLEGSAHDMGREFQIIEALGPTAVPVPAVVGYHGEADIAGAPFFVMEHVGGETIADPDVAGALSAAAKGRLARELAAVLATLHAVDPAVIGLGALRRPTGLIERQLRRWGGQIDGYDRVSSDLFRPVLAALANRVPEPQRVSLVHGDFKLGNLRVDADGRVVAVLDWELAAIGDPLVDLGWLLASWAQPDEPGVWIAPPPTAGGGFCSRAELLAAYAEHSELDLSQLHYYLAFAYWRWSCINEGVVARAEAGAGMATKVDAGAARAQIRWQLQAADDLLSGARSDLALGA